MTEKPVAVVTGGAGFIGSHMVDTLLARGYAVRVIDNLTGGRKSNLAHLDNGRDIECHWLDIRSLEPDSPIFAGAHFVFHFAGIGDIVPSIEKPIEYMDVNVQGTVRVLECCARRTSQEIRLCGVVVLLRTWRRRRPTKTIPSPRNIPTHLSKYLGEVDGVPLA